MTTEVQEPPSIAQPPSAGEMTLDRAFRALTRGFGWLTILVVVLKEVQLPGHRGVLQTTRRQREAGRST